MIAADVPSEPTFALAFLLLLGNAAAATYGIAMRPLAGGFMQLYLFGLSWAIAWWIVADARQRRIGHSIDFGWFLFLAWPILAPWYLVRTRGMAGCGMALLVFVGFVASYATTFTIAAFLLHAH